MIAILNMKLPPYCGKCPLQDGEICYAINENDIGSGLSFFDLEDLRNFCIKRRDDCPLIEIDENNPMLLEFLNEFDKWRAYKEVMDYIKSVYKEGEANDIL